MPRIRPTTWLALIWLLLWPAPYACANSGDGIPISGAAIRYLVDEAGDLTLEQALRRERGWLVSERATPSFGFTSDTYWYRFTLEPIAKPMVLELGYALLDDVQLWLLESGEIRQTVVTGDARPFDDRPVDHRLFLFNIEPHPHPQEVILRIRTSSSMQVPLRLWPENSLFEADQYTFMQQGLYYGIALFMTIYAAFLFFRVNDKAYAWYGLYVALFALAQMSISGLAFQFLWPDSVGWNQRCVAVLTPLIVLPGTLFASHFLTLKNSHALLHRISLGLGIIAVVISALSLFLPYQRMIPFGAALAIITCLYILSVSYYVAWKNRHKYAFYFAAAWSIFLLGTVMLALNKFGLIPRTVITESGAQIGSAIEIILLAFALAERLHDANVYRLKAERENRRINQQLLATHKEMSQRLEVEVATRTHELSKVLTQVEDLNRELRVLSNTDALTGAWNRRHFDEHLKHELQRAFREQQPLALIMIDLDHFKAVNDQHGHLAGDACLKAVTRCIQKHLRRPADQLSRYGGEEMAICLPNTPLTGAVVVAEMLRESIESLRIEAEGIRLSVTASLGVCSAIPERGYRPDLWVDTADQALYQAKEAGRNRVVSRPLHQPAGESR